MYGCKQRGPRRQPAGQAHAASPCNPVCNPALPQRVHATNPRKPAGAASTRESRPQSTTHERLRALRRGHLHVDGLTGKYRCHRVLPGSAKKSRTELECPSAVASRSASTPRTVASPVVDFWCVLPGFPGGTAGRRQSHKANAAGNGPLHVPAYKQAACADTGRASRSRAVCNHTSKAIVRSSQTMHLSCVKISYIFE
jgi:hypothetical protein